MDYSRKVEKKYIQVYIINYIINNKIILINLTTLISTIVTYVYLSTIRIPF